MVVAAPARRRPRATAVARPSSVWVAVAVTALAFALAALTLLWQSTPGFDAWGWLNWARDFTTHGSFSTRWYPSWKPLPFLVGVPLTVTGSAATPDLWLWLVRGFAFLSLALAFRVARRLAGAFAGVVAVTGILLLPGWPAALTAGRVEPMLLAFILLGVERHRAGHRLQALALGVLVGMARNEAWPLLAAYALWIVVERPRRLPATALALATLPLAWLGGDYEGSGHPLHGGWLAKGASNIAPQLISGHPERYVAQVALQVLPAPWMIAALLGVLDALRRRQVEVLVLAAAGVLWLGFDVVGAHFHYPGDPRFMSPAGGLLAVVAGVGAARTLALVRWHPAATAVAGLALLAVGVAFAVSPVSGAVDDLRHIKINEGLSRQLALAVERFGGRPALERCGRVTVDQSYQAEFAWSAGMTDVQVRDRIPPAVAFAIAGHGLQQRLARMEWNGAVRLVRLGTVGVWNVIAVEPWDRPSPPACAHPLRPA